MRFRCFLLGITLLFCRSTFAQWVPVNSTQTTTMEVTSADGKKISYEQRREHYYRKSNGSLLIQQIPNDGSNTPTTAILLDNGKTHRSYKVDYVNGVAVDRHRPAQADTPRTRAFLAAAKPEDRPREETVNGIRCVVKPVSLVNPDGSLKTIGKVWLAPDYNFLLIKENTMHPLPGGGYMHITREVHNVLTGAEPDDALFATDAPTIKRARALSGPKSGRKW